MSTANLTDVLSSDVAACFGVNTHWKDDGSAYRDPANPNDPDPNAEATVLGLGCTVWRERFNNLGPQNQAIVDLRPMTQFGQAGIDVNTVEADCRAMIHAIAISSRKGDVWAFTGANEPNDQSGTSQTWKGAGPWWDQVVKQQYWIWDQVQIEVDAGSWTATPGVAGGRPYVVGPGVKHEHVPLDTDIAGLAAATYTTAGIAYHMADLCDFGDLHFYPSKNGPGFRMNGKDDNGDVPPGITLSAIDGKVSQEVFEVQRFRQIYDSKLTGGTASFVSGHYKYVGGSVTTGHGLDFPMCHSEWGYVHTEGSGWTKEEWQAWGAIAGPATLLRDLYAVPLDTGSQGLRMSIVYQAVNDRGSDPDMGIYNLAQFPTGNYPIYDALQTLCTYPGSTTFVGVGAFKDIGGTLPDCKGLAFSESATEWWLYVLREADNTAHLELSAAYKVEGVAISGDGTYHLDLSQGLTIWHVIPTGGGGGAPVWTDTILGDRVVGGAYTDAVTATAATSYSLLSGTLPTGLALNTGTGAVTGTPTVAGAYPFVVRATNGSGSSDSPTITITIYTNPAFTADSPPLTGTVGVAYGTAGDGYVYEASGFPAPTFGMKGGTVMPGGMALSADGTFSGTPTTAGTYSVGASATNNLLTPATGATHSLVIAAGGGGSPGVPEFTVPPPPPPDGTKGEAYDFRFRAEDPNGVEDPTFSVASGTIPPGMVLSAGGHLKSKPLVKGTYVFSIAATNSAGTATTADLTVNVVDTQDHGEGQTITYALAGPNSACSFYPWFRGTTIAEDKSARFAVISDVNGNTQAVIRVKQSGKLVIDDTDGNSIAKGDAFYALFDTDPAARWRCSLVIGFDGTNMSVVLRPYAELESTQASDVLASLPIPVAAAPYQIEFGNKTGEVDMALDSITFSSQAQEIPPQEPGVPGTLTPLYTIAGPGATPSTSIKVHSRFVTANATKAANLAYSLSPTMSSPALAGSQTIDADGMGRWTVFGLDPATRYYFRVVEPTSGTYYGEQASFPTLPATTGAWSVKVANISCLTNPKNGQVTQLAFQDINAWQPDLIPHSGDWGYWGGTIKANEPYSHDLQKYDKANSQVPALRQMIQSALLVATISDHELHDNGDDWDGKGTEDPTGAFNCPHSVREMGAYTALFPVAAYGDVRVPKRHRGYSFDIGSQVRVIVTDFRSPDRSNALDAESAGKTMWGAVQRAWIYAQLDATKVNLFVNETSYWHNTGALRATDKPASYVTDQQDFEDKLNGTGAYAGGVVYAAAWVGGDRHYVGYFNSTDSDLGRPQYIGSGLGGKAALQLQEGEDPTWAGEFLPDNTDDKFEMCQWQQLTIAFDGVDTVTITSNGRVGGTVLQLTDGVCTSGSPVVTSGAGKFLPAHAGMLIAGDGIRSTPNPTTILSYQSPTQVTLSQNATSTKAAGAWTVQNPQSVWQMSDFPGGSPTVDTWTLVDADGAGPAAPQWIGA